MNISGTSGLSGLQNANSIINRSAERIASGSRINNAGDDASGLALSNRMSAQVNGFNQSIRNANDGISMLQTKGASLQGVNDAVHRLRELALQASNGILSDSDRGALDDEAQQLLAEINQTVQTSSFNGKSLLSNGDNIRLQVGANAEDGIDLEQGDFSQMLEDAGLNNIDFSSASGATSALSVLDQVQADINSVNADIGAGINRLDSSISNLHASAIEAQESRSRIKDADIAKEITDLVNGQVKRDSSIAMQVLANQQKSSVLRFLGGT